MSDAPKPEPYRCPGCGRTTYEFHAINCPQDRPPVWHNAKKPAPTPRKG